MKKKVNAKLSKEVVEVFNESAELCKKNGVTKTNLESMVLTIIKKYLSGQGEESEELKQALKRLNDTEKKDLLRDLETDFELSISRDEIPFPGETMRLLFDVLFSEQTAEIIDRALEDTDYNLDLSSLLCAILKTPDCTFIEGLKDYGINVDILFPEESLFKSLGDNPISDLLKHLGKGKASVMKVGSLDDLFNGGSIFKEKNLSYSSDEPAKTEEEIKKENENAERAFEAAGKGGAICAKKANPNSKTPNLDQFSVCMNDKALSDKKYDPVIGRENETKEIIRILSCRLCKNPMLLGDPGCGKTAIVEHLATLIASKDPIIPESLLNKKIYNLDINAIVAGCMYRGQFEERMQNIVKEVVAAEDIIVYIDEVHNMVGAGAGQQDKGDMANILKPFLSRGEFQCIGSTTTAEFRKVIENDKALVRRFDPVFIGEPNIDDTVAIIKGLKSKYEDYHKVKYSEEAIRACVEWADRYVYGSFFPAKAIKILDKAGADVKIDRPISKPEKISDLETKISELDDEKGRIILGDPDNWGKADEISEQSAKLKTTLGKEMAKFEKNKSGWPKVEASDISSVISSTTGVPVNKIKSSDMDKVRDMKKTLDSKVIGQEEAITELSIALQQNMLGLRDPKKPIASFLFVGPTGVGKTFVSKTVAREFFGSDKNLVTIACSEYMQDWAESKLLGSAPGYVGFNDSEPRLYILKRQPYTVLLIDEVEKSSKNLYNIWLNMLEEGEVTLSSGEKISCRNCIIIFTGNVGTKSLELKGNGIGFGHPEGEEKKKADTATVMKEVEKEFRPEFLNRLSKIVVFNSLEKNDLGKIFDNELVELKSQIKKESKLDIKVMPKVKDLIISKCEPKYGARSLKRLINEYIQKEICKKMLEVEVIGKSVTVDLGAEDKVEVEFK